MNIYGTTTISSTYEEESEKCKNIQTLESASMSSSPSLVGSSNPSYNFLMKKSSKSIPPKSATNL
jgi:hypothetical protein